MLGSVLLRLLTVAGSVALTACGGAPARDELDPRGVATASRPVEAGTSDACPSPLARVSEGREVGRVRSPMLTEVSGVVASRAQPGLLWVHDDSGTGAILFAIDLEGHLLAQLTLEGAPAFDWEDIALEVVPGGPDRLWIADVGDNAARDASRDPRESVTIIRIEEPEIDPARAPIVETRTQHDVFTLRYPDRPHDSEAIAIDPATGDLLLFAKENEAGSDVYRAAAPISDGADVVLEVIAQLGCGPMITACDISPDGRALLVRTYRSVLAWQRVEGEPWSQVLARPPRTMPARAEPQGESIAFLADGSAYLTISEGTDVPIWLFESDCE